MSRPGHLNGPTMPVLLRTPRPQPIRDAILAFLSEPRSASQVAAHIERSVPNATGHLAAMRRKGLVLRLGYAAYARSDYDGPPVAFYRPHGPRSHSPGRAIVPVSQAGPIRKTPL